MNIDIINLDDDLASVALRSILEYWGCTVAIHHVATAQQLVRLLNGETALSKHIVFMCHGVEQGVALAELAPEIAAQQPYQSVVSADNFQEFLHLPDRLVLNTGCLTGRPEFAAAFLRAGCHTYCIFRVGLTEWLKYRKIVFQLLHCAARCLFHHANQTVSHPFSPRTTRDSGATRSLQQAFQTPTHARSYSAAGRCQ